ncbi:MAG: hypothetical protein KH009_08840 [Clostridiales bacterium]|nr:hypothetical protein [Clostridiales bacterium]
MKKQMLAAMLITSLLLSGCNQTGEISSSPDLPEVSRSSAVDNVSEEIPDEEEPTEEVLMELLDRAMNEIMDLASDDTADILSDIFAGDIKCDYSNQVIIDGISWQWTSRQYSELVDYYSQTFTGEALDWVLNSRFADVDGVLYCFPGGGATGISSKVVSIEKLGRNSYQAHYQWFSITDDIYEDDTTFSIQKTDTGYRISSIGYHPSHLDREWFRAH